MGIGSVCRRNADSDIIEIIKTIKKELPDHIKLHAFGVKISILKNKEIFDALDSIDTFAWNWGCMNCKGIRYDTFIKMLKEYQIKLNRIIKRQEEQKSFQYFGVGK